MKRAKHSLSCYRALTGDMGELLPIGLQEVLPGDSFQHNTSLLLRVSPLNFPVMHPVRVKIEHYFVPDRIVWEDSEDFHTGGEDGTAAPTFPTISFTGGAQAAVGSLADYLGVPTGMDVVASAIPFRGYAKIYNDHKRNTLVQTPLTIDLTSGADTTTNTALKLANWQKDRFTDAHPEPQLGPEVTVSLGTNAPVYLDPTTGQYQKWLKTSDHTAIGNTGINADGTFAAASPAAAVGATPLVLDPQDTLLADLSAATGISVRQLRESTALQRFMEAQMLHGSRYSDLLAQWGVRSSDARLQRPEYLGGGIQTIQFSEVLQTGVTTSGATAGVGNLRGHGIATARSNRYRRTFEEHGYVFTLLTVLPTTMYAQGVPKTLLRRTKTDFYTPQFAHVGEEEIYNKEVYAAHATPDGIFAYGPRYESYRQAISSIHGEFRSTLDIAHYARLFTSDPAFNSAFITSNPTKRVNQVTTSDVLWLFAHHSLQSRRIVTSNSTPGGTL